MRSEILAVVLVAMVAGSLTIGYFSGSSNRQTTTVVSTQLVRTGVTTLLTTTATKVSIGCSRPFSVSTIEGPNSSSSLVVFDMNATGWVCVTIYNNYDMNVSAPNSNLEVWLLQGNAWVVSRNLNVSTSPARIKLAPNSQTLSFFEIVPLNESQAIYLVWLPSECWGNILVGVGYSVAQLQGLRVTLPNTFTSCPAISGYSVVTGTTNLLPTYTK